MGWGALRRMKQRQSVEKRLLCGSKWLMSTCSGASPTSATALKAQSQVCSETNLLLLLAVVQLSVYSHTACWFPELGSDMLVGTQHRGLAGL